MAQDKTKTRHRLNPKAVILIMPLFTATNAVFFKLSEVPGMVFVSGRFFICAVVFLAAAFIRIKISREKRDIIKGFSTATVLELLLLGGMYSLGAFSYFTAMRDTAYSSVLILGCANTIFVFILSIIFLKDRPRARSVIAILVTIGGCILVFIDKAGGSNTIMGNCCALGAAMSAAIYTVTMKHFSHLDVPLKLGIVYAGSFICSFTISMIQGNSYTTFSDGASYPYYEYLWILASAVLAICIPQTFINRALRHVKASFAGSAALLEPIFGILYGYIIWPESIPLINIVGGVLVLGGLFWYTRTERI